MTRTLDDPPPLASRGRRRSKISRARLARTRLAVYGRDGYACVQCGWKPGPPPPGYDGARALGGDCIDLLGGSPDGRHWWLPVTWLELDHVIARVNGGPFEIPNLQSPCNRRKGAR